MRNGLRLVVGSGVPLAEDLGTIRPPITPGPAPARFAFAEGRSVSLIAPPAGEAPTTAGIVYTFGWERGLKRLSL